MAHSVERGRDMSTMPSSFALDRHDAPQGDRDIARLLANRYGDGTVYLPSGASIALYRSSIERGFVSAEGFITTKGRRLLAFSS